MKNQNKNHSLPVQTKFDLKYFDEEAIQKNFWLRIKKFFLELKTKIHQFGISRFSIIIVPHSNNQGINIHLSNYVFLFFGLIVMTTVITTTAILASGQKNSRIQVRLIEENNALEQRFYNVSQTVESLTDYFAQFRLEVGSIVNSPIESSTVASLNAPEISLVSNTITEEIAQLQILQKELDVTKEKIFRIGNFMLENKRTLKEIPSIYPVATRARITSRFGVRKNPFDHRGIEAHDGLDMATFPGTPIYATADGLVSKVGVQGGYGNLIEIKHKYGFVTRYGHMQGFASQIYPNARVKQGQVIGYVGATGRVTGYHLHYEVLIGNTRVNPEPFVMMLR
ncbi:MAG: M23 family metallopeptidase [Brevinema sp.]